MAAKVRYRAGAYLPPQGLVIAVTVLMALLMLFQVLSGISSLMQYELLGRIQGAGDWTQREAELNDFREGMLGLATLGAYLATAVAFLKLLGRLNYNAWSLGAEGMQFTPGWTIGWFFVPVLNLVRPYQAVQELWKVSQPGEGAWQSRPSSGLVIVWWALWIVSNVLGQISMRLAFAEDNVNLLRTGSLVSGFESALDVVLSLVALFLVRQIVSFQEERQATGARYDVQSLHCPNCGEPVTPDLERCPLCGSGLEDALVVVE